MNSLVFICFFTFIIHLAETLAYSMRLAGLRTKQIAIAMSFVTSTLLISRLSNMFQAPLLGAMVDFSILKHSQTALNTLAFNFRFIIFAAFLGSLAGAFLTPTMVYLFQKAISRFLKNGSLPKTILQAFKPRNFIKIMCSFKRPRLIALKSLSLKNIPKTFLVMNVFVTSIYTIGVLCSLYAGACLPAFRSTAIQLSGIVNGMATIIFTLIVDPSGARITDQAMHGVRPENDLKTVIVSLQIGRMIGILILAQLFFMPFSFYIMKVAQFISLMAH
ncbi:MAG: DUF2837 family protein [Candidatus Margulisiibacteriota bacterium]|jgi:hypothetical protein